MPDEMKGENDYLGSPGININIKKKPLQKEASKEE